MFTDTLREAIRRRAIHEAGHAVFAWRSGGDDTIAPFNEIVVGGHDPLDENPPPLMLEDGTTTNADGVVSYQGCYRVPVSDARKRAGLSRRERQEFIKSAKAVAREVVIWNLAGPVVEAAADGRTFDWADDWWDEYNRNEDGDCTEAFSIVDEELCGGKKCAASFMDEIVSYIEIHLKQDPRYWRTIHALADALVAQLRLDHDEAVSVMRAVWHGDALQSDQKEAA